MSQVRKLSAVQFFITLTCIFIVIAGMKAARDLLCPIFLAAFLATISYPITRALQRIKVPRVLAVMLTVIIDFGFVLGIGVLVNYLAEDFATTSAQKYTLIINQHINNMQLWIDRCGYQSHANTLIGIIREYLSPAWLLSLTTGFVAKAANLAGLFILELFLMSFFLSETHIFKDNFERLKNTRGAYLNNFTSAANDLQRYLGIKTLISILTGLAVWGICLWLNIDFALLWGIVAFCLNYVPSIGSIVASLPPVLLAFLTQGMGSGLLVGVILIVMNVFLGQIIEPLLYGYRFNMPTSIVLLSVIFWGWVLGPTGMLLAVPLTMLSKVLFSSTSDLAWLSVLLAKHPQRIEAEKPAVISNLVEKIRSNAEKSADSEKS